MHIDNVIFLILSNNAYTKFSAVPSVPTLCKISKVLHLSADYILFGQLEQTPVDSFSLMLDRCTDTERTYAEQLVKTFVMAMDSKKELV